MDPLYNALDGHVVLDGYQPDGDSFRFLPRDPSRLADLRRAPLIERSRRDGTVQIRLEGIDAPELHYNHPNASQPRASGARDALLTWLGVDPASLEYTLDGAVVASRSSAISAPRVLPVTVYTNGADSRGRPIGYLARARPGTGRNGERVHPRRCRVTASVLRATANYDLIANGNAYLLAYTSLPHGHRQVLRDAARAARAKARGVWRDDVTTRGFALCGGQRAIGPHGALIFPKLFRRCVDYLLHRHAYGFAGNFVDWLSGHGTAGSTKPDRVTVRHAANIPFCSLLSEQRDRIALATDVTDLVFVES